MSLPKISYVNGRYARHKNAYVHIEDRGYQFADGVYEVILYLNGKMLDGEKHLERLKYSLNQLKIPMPVSYATFKIIISELARRNNIVNGTVYIQVTRGIAPRNHPFPKNPIKPSLVIVMVGLKTPPNYEYEKGVSVILRPDIRWKRCDVKSISLLPNILAKQEAVISGVKEVWFYNNEGIITEGGSSNAAIVDQSGIIRTHPANNNILDGVTRNVVLKLARENGIAVKELSFSIDDIKTAREAFITSTTIGILPIVSIDGKMVGSGKPGSITRKLISIYEEHIRENTVN